MHDPHTTTSLSGLRIYVGDELVFDGDDPSTYTVCHTAQNLERAIAAAAAERTDSEQAR